MLRADCDSPLYDRPGVQRRARRAPSTQFHLSYLVRPVERPILETIDPSAAFEKTHGGRYQSCLYL